MIAGPAGHAAVILSRALWWGPDRRSHVYTACPGTRHASSPWTAYMQFLEPYIGILVALGTLNEDSIVTKKHWFHAAQNLLLLF